MRLHPGALLKSAVETARSLEHAASQKQLRKPLQVVGLGSLVRHRRIAMAIQALGRRSAYESRVLLRTMVEIQINYAWIRLRNSHSRALRFCQFPPLEKLRLLEKTATIFKPDDYDQRRLALLDARRKVRHLFRFRDKNGEMRWSRSWASVSSVEARLTEVLKKESPKATPDPFLYGMFVSFSSATHGSPNSVADVLTAQNGRAAASPQPEPSPNVHKQGAFILLAWIIEAFSEDARLRRQCHTSIHEIRTIVHELKQRSKYL